MKKDLELLSTHVTTYKSVQKAAKALLKDWNVSFFYVFRIMMIILLILLYEQ
jgi:hypothetical protein